MLSFILSINKAIEYWSTAGAGTGSPEVREGYWEEYQKADMTFMHQSVFDPVSKKIVSLTPIDPNFIESVEFLGRYQLNILIYTS